jgi:predicted dehydrogenase
MVGIRVSSRLGHHERVMASDASTLGRPFRVGVIGTGFGAAVHVPAFKAAPGFEVVAIVSGHRENAERVAREHGIAWSGDDYRAMLREVELDVVSIATPGGLHHDIALAAAEAGRHVLCESRLPPAWARRRRC